MDTYMGRALEAIERTVAPLDAAAIGRKVEARWSVCDILEHLTLAFAASAATFEKALAYGSVKAQPPDIRQRIGRILVVDVGYFPKVEAPERTRPRGSVTPDGSLAAIRGALVTLDDTMTRVADRFGTTTLAANHPYLAGLTIPQWRKFHWRHTLHHMRQVRERTQ